jgi:hypothetical protein
MFGACISKISKGACKCGMLENAGGALSEYASQEVAHACACRKISHRGLHMSIVQRPKISKGAHKCRTLQDAIWSSTAVHPLHRGPHHDTYVT